MATRQPSLTACHYTDDARRPGCQHIAEVAYGTIALCADCDRRRSTVGKGTIVTRLNPRSLQAVRQAAEELDRAQQHLDDTVRSARHNRATWAQIADTLGVTRQAAHQRWNTMTH